MGYSKHTIKRGGRPFKKALYKEALKRIEDWIQHGDIENELNLSDLNLGSLPDIPETVKILVCDRNDLTELPLLSHLEALSCENNQLKKIPFIPNLTYLNCSHNYIGKIPLLSKLILLDCNDNNITKIPFLPNLLELTCSDNRITTIPILPKLTYIECENNEIPSEFPHESAQDYLKRINNMFNGNIMNNYNAYIKKLKEIEDDTTPTFRPMLIYNEHLPPARAELLNRYLAFFTFSRICERSFKFSTGLNLYLSLKRPIFYEKQEKHEKIGIIAKLETHPPEANKSSHAKVALNLVE